MYIYILYIYILYVYIYKKTENQEIHTFINKKEYFVTVS